ncbi:MAG TPA: C4-dicarboxylate ABC transporter permease, partial [Sphaerochaeta sp.]|jgi:putative tricarboxylic transport membrane protein|nr:C4-dicarboxylate ABC transporter permease [Sphaerochaeta sp.]
MLFFGVLGYFLQKADASVSPAVLGLILGPMAESNFRRALLMSEGNYGIFFTSPIAWVFLILTVITLFGPFVGDYLKKRKTQA